MTMIFSNELYFLTFKSLIHFLMLSKKYPMNSARDYVPLLLRFNFHSVFTYDLSSLLTPRSWDYCSFNVGKDLHLT